MRYSITHALKVVTSEKIGGSGVTSTLGTWYGGVVMGVLLFLYRDFNSAPAHKRIVGATRNSQHLLLFVANTICAAKAFYSCPAIISRRPGSQNTSKEPQLNPEKDSRRKQARSHVPLEKSS